MLLWTPNCLFNQEVNELKMFNMPLFKEYLKIYIPSPDVTWSLPSSSAGTESVFKREGINPESPSVHVLKDMYLFSIDIHSGQAVKNFMNQSFKYLHNKTCEMVNDGLLVGARFIWHINLLFLASFLKPVQPKIEFGRDY